MLCGDINTEIDTTLKKKRKTKTHQCWKMFCFVEIHNIGKRGKFVTFEAKKIKFGFFF